MEIVIEPWKKLVIHELAEYQLEELLQVMAAINRAAGGGIIPLNWADGVVFHAVPLAPSEAIIEESLKGTIHYASVMFALKESFEKEIRKEYGTFMMADMSTNEFFAQLSSVLKEHSKLGKSKH